MKKGVSIFVLFVAFQLPALLVFGQQEIPSILKKGSDELPNVPELEGLDRKAKMEQVDAWNEKAWELGQSQPDSGKEMASRAFLAAKKIGYPAGQAESLNNLGYFERFHGHYDKALKLYRKALEICEENAVGDEMATAFNNIGVVHYLIGDHPNALDHFYKAVRVRDTIGDPLGKSSTLSNIGVILKKEGKFESSLEYHRRALELRRDHGDSMDVATSYLVLGSTYLDMGRTQKAREYLEKAKREFEKKGFQKDLSNCWYMIGRSYLKEDLGEKALEYFRKARKVKNELGDLKGTLEISNKMVRAYLMVGDDRIALDLAEMVVNEAANSKLLEVESNAHQNLSMAYERIGKPELAVKELKHHIRLKDSLHSKRKSEQLQRLQTVYEAERKEKELSDMRAERKEAELAREKMMIYFMAGGGAVLFILIGMIWSYWQNRKHNRKLEERNRLIEEKNRMLRDQNSRTLKEKEEKEILLKEVHHRVKNNLQVINSLVNLQTKELEDPRVLQLFQETKTRVRSMALLHEKMYAQEDLTKVDLPDYLKSLVREIVRTFGPDADIELNISIEVDSLGFSNLTPLGLILNELVSNSLKYAFKDRDKGKLEIGLKKKGEGEYELIVEDDGPGVIPEDLKKGDSLGAVLIESLAEQLDGSVSYFSSEKGMRVVVAFKAENGEDR